MKLIIERKQTYLDVTDRKLTILEVADFQVAANAIQKALLTTKGDLVTRTATDVVRKGVGADGQVPVADSTKNEGWEWKSLETGGGSATLTNKSGSNLGLGAVVIGDKDNDKAFKTTTKDTDPAIQGVLGEAINDQASGRVLVGPQLATVLVQGNVGRGDWLVTSTTAGRARSRGKQKPRYALAQAQTVYSGGGAGSVEAILDFDRGNIAFLPTDIGGLLMWQDASQLTGINNGDPVSLWTDASGNNRTWSAAGAVRPTYIASGINGLPIVRFAGAHYLNADFGAVTSPNSIFIVALRSTSGVQMMLIEQEGAGSGATDLYITTGNVVTFATINSTVLTLSVPYLINTRTTAGAGGAQMWLNGVNQGTATGVTSTNIARMGANPSPANYLTGDIAELIVYNTVLAEGDRQQVEGYLRAKYNLW